METAAFDAVWIWGLPEDYGTGASSLAAAAIEPESSTQDDRWDAATVGGLVVTSRVTITFLYRHEDPQLRDEAAELLFDTAANALNGQCLAGLTLPQLTRFVSWRWEKPIAPERRITASIFLSVYRRRLGLIRRHALDQWSSSVVSRSSDSASPTLLVVKPACKLHWTTTRENSHVSDKSANQLGLGDFRLDRDHPHHDRRLRTGRKTPQIQG